MEDGFESKSFFLFPGENFEKFFFLYLLLVVETQTKDLKEVFSLLPFYIDEE